MVKTHTRSAQKKRMYVYIPAFLREDFGITLDSDIDITKENGKIVITVLSDQK